MQRELKFKSWDKHYGKMSQPFSLFELEGYEGESNAVVYNEGSHQWVISNNGKLDDNYLILEYTGLKDKNDKEIYEGDIIKYSIFEMTSHVSIFYFQVIWDNFYKGWALAKTDGLSLNHTGLKFYNCDIQEVVGNIFENPELLEK